MSLVDLHKKIREEEFPDYLLQSAQLNTSENLQLFDAALHGRHDEVLALLKEHGNTGIRNSFKSFDIISYGPFGGNRRKIES